MVVLWADTDRLLAMRSLSRPRLIGCTTWTGLTISGTKQPSIGNLPSKLTIPSSKTRCLSWHPCVKRSPIISRTVSQAGNWSCTSPVDCEGRAVTEKTIKGE